MHPSEMLDIIEDVLAGKPVGIEIAHSDEVKADVRHRYDALTRRVTLDVRFTAREDVEIGNYGVTLSYRTPNALRAVRGWGEAQGPQIAGGVDLTVIDSGTFPAECTVGTFITTDTGYKLWMKTERFEIKT